MKIVVTAVVAMAAGALLIVPAANASTDNGKASTTGVANSASVKNTASVKDDVCEAARKATKEPGKCEATETTTVDAAAVASADQVTAGAKLVASDGTALSLAAANATIYTRTWSEEARGLYYINWWEKHTGRIYFDNAGHVWSTTARSGYTGYHLCDQGGGIGYSIKVTSCSTEQRYDLSRPAISEWDRYQVHVVAKGIPIYASHAMHANAYDDGNITFP